MEAQPPMPGTHLTLGLSASTGSLLSMPGLRSAPVIPHGVSSEALWVLH